MSADWKAFPYKGCDGIPIIGQETFGHLPSTPKPWFIQSSHSPFLIYTLLAWEPSVAKGTHIYSSRLPALGRFYRETKFSVLKSTHSTKNLNTKQRTFPWFSRFPQSKSKSVQGFLSYDLVTNRQTNRHYNFLSIDDI